MVCNLDNLAIENIHTISYIELFAIDRHDFTNTTEKFRYNKGLFDAYRFFHNILRFYCLFMAIVFVMLTIGTNI
jgi:hypothetical protein